MKARARVKVKMRERGRETAKSCYQQSSLSGRLSVTKGVDFWTSLSQPIELGLVFPWARLRTLFVPLSFVPLILVLQSSKRPMLNILLLWYCVILGIVQLVFAWWWKGRGKERRSDEVKRTKEVGERDGERGIGVVKGKDEDVWEKAKIWRRKKSKGKVSGGELMKRRERVRIVWGREDCVRASDLAGNSVRRM